MGGGGGSLDAGAAAGDGLGPSQEAGQLKGAGNAAAVSESAEARLKKNEDEKQKQEDAVARAEEEGYFTVTRDLRVVSAMIVLDCTLLTSYAALCLRLTIIDEIPQEVALLLSIIAIFVASAET